MNVKKCVRALLCLYLTLIIAMDAVKGQSLKVGDTLPPELWSLPLDVINHPEGKDCVTLADYKDKLIILDFWATWCAPCIKSLTKLDTLQKEFGEQLAVVPITYENADKVLPFLTKRGYQLPSIINDSTLKKYFPHRSIPHQVWVRAGEVLAVTGAEAAVKENIYKALASQPIRTLRLKDNLDPLDKTKPIIGADHADKLLYQSIATKRIPNASAGTSRNGKGLSLFNLGVHDLFVEAYSDTILWTSRFNRIVSLLPDSLHEKVFRPEYAFRADLESMIKLEAWNEENTYCYALTFPRNVDKKEILRTAKSELNKFFGVHLGIAAQIENRNVKCLVLVNLNNEQTNLPSNGARSYKNDGKNTSFMFENYPFRNFVQILEEQNKFSSYPIVDQTNYSGNISFHFDGPLHNIRLVRSELHRAGFDIIEMDLPIDMLVFSQLTK